MAVLNPEMIPPQFREDAGRFPPVLRALLHAELAAGNAIVSSGFHFPACPAGCFFILAKPVTTRARASADGLKFYQYSRSDYSGSFTDEGGMFFLLEPPLPTEPERDMDAIRAAHAPSSTALPPPVLSEPGTALGRFEQSMVIDYEKWHDGIGYDLDALKEATPEERNSIEMLLVRRGAQDWRDVEALAALGTAPANEILKTAHDNPDPKISMAVARFAPDLIPHAERSAALVNALKTATLSTGLSQALDQAAGYHPKEVVDALFHGALERDGETAVHCAALLMYVHGKAVEPFDWSQRPFFLRFNTTDRKARKTAFMELCQKIGIEAYGADR